MPLDASILLQSQPAQIPNPMALAGQGISLANLANQNQLISNQVEQQRQYSRAVQELGSGMSSGQDPNAMMSSVAQKYPLAYAKILADQRALQLTQAQIAEAQGKAQEASSKAFSEYMKPAQYRAAAIVSSGNVSPMDAQALVAQTAHAYQVAGVDPASVGLPSVMSSPDTLMSFAKGLASSGQSPLDAAKVQEIIQGTLPKAQAETQKAQVETGLAPFQAQTGRIGANAAMSQAGAHWADINLPKVEVDAFGRPLALYRNGPGGGPSISLAPTMPGAAPQAPAAPAGISDQVSRATGMGAASPAPAGQGAPLPSPGASQAQMIATYQAPPPNRASPFSSMLMDQVKAINPNYDATQWEAKQKTVEAFSTGPQGDMIRSQNVAISHMALLNQLAQALQNKDVQAWNLLANRLAAESGSPVPTNFNAAASLVGKEVAKAVVPGAGGEGERQGIEQTFANAQSYPQISGTIGTYQSLLGGQMHGMKQQYEANTGLNDFQKFVAPETAAIVNKVSATAGGPRAGRATSDKLPDPSTLPNGAVVTNNATGQKLTVVNGRYTQ